MVTSGLSLLPGGLGVVDAALVLTLVAGGIPASSALPVVVLYRLISLVGVVAAGWLVCAVQHLGHDTVHDTAAVPAAAVPAVAAPPAGAPDRPGHDPAGEPPGWTAV
jgi:hypothetical protein